MGWWLRQWPASVYPKEANDLPEAKPEIDAALRALGRSGPQLEEYGAKCLGQSQDGLWQLSFKVNRKQIRILYAPYDDVIVVFRIHPKTSPQEQQRAYALARDRKKQAERRMKEHGGARVGLPLPSIDLDLPRKLQDPEYRERFFLAEASAEIARQLIALRKRRQLSQVELAQRANTQQPAVSRVEQADYQNWSFNTLRKLTNAMEGRLTVKIEAWEDVVAEYYSEDDHHPPSGSQPPAAHAQAKDKRPKVRASAGMAGESPPDLAALAQGERWEFNPGGYRASLLDEISKVSRDEQGRPQ
jgi:transcriptional regulator with XRE-family HTH domain